MKINWDYKLTEPEYKHRDYPYQKECKVRTRQERESNIREYCKSCDYFYVDSECVDGHVIRENCCEMVSRMGECAIIDRIEREGE